MSVVTHRMRVDGYWPGTAAGDDQPVQTSHYFDLPAWWAADSVPTTWTGATVFETIAGRTLRERRETIQRGGYD